MMSIHIFICFFLSKWVEEENGVVNGGNRNNEIKNNKSVTSNWTLGDGIQKGQKGIIVSKFKYMMIGLIN